MCLFLDRLREALQPVLQQGLGVFLTMREAVIDERATVVQRLDLGQARQGGALQIVVSNVGVVAPSTRADVILRPVAIRAADLHVVHVDTYLLEGVDPNTSCLILIGQDDAVSQTAANDAAHKVSRQDIAWTTFHDHGVDRVRVGVLGLVPRAVGVPIHRHVRGSRKPRVDVLGILVLCKEMLKSFPGHESVVINLHEQRPRSAKTIDVQLHRLQQFPCEERTPVALLAVEEHHVPVFARLFVEAVRHVVSALAKHELHYDWSWASQASNVQHLSDRVSAMFRGISCRKDGHEHGVQETRLNEIICAIFCIHHGKAMDEVALQAVVHDVRVRSPGAENCRLKLIVAVSAWEGYVNDGQALLLRLIDPDTHSLVLV
mmetsp:Transcript_49222/g.107067  ORF Transcript_49222/g.107067 Transcript_49222/m.107067 type:complete len:375 (-) Transcript_49222:810-1934(-)